MKIFLKWFYLYSEGRERRNNITHHGTTPTAKYKKSMESTFLVSKIRKSHQKRVISTLKNNPREKRQIQRIFTIFQLLEII